MSDTKRRIWPWGAGILTVALAVFLPEPAWAKRAADWLRDDFHRGVQRAELVLTARVEEVGESTITVGGKWRQQVRQIRFTPVALEKGVFHRDQLELSSGDWSSGSDGVGGPGELHLLFMSRVSFGYRVIASRKVSGPFDPNGVTYTVSNNGGQDLDFQVAADVGWLDLPSGSVTLPGGDPAINSVEVQVGFAPSAASLGEGLYLATLTFSNLTTGNGDTTREISLLADNCPQVANPAQANSDLPPAGDLCQCSDLDADASTDMLDAVLMERVRLGAPVQVDSTRCVVDGGLDLCTRRGITAVRESLVQAPVCGFLSRLPRRMIANVSPTAMPCVVPPPMTTLPSSALST